MHSLLNHINGDSFTLIVKTNRPKTEILSFDKEKNMYIVAVKAPPQEGKANTEIVKFFTKSLKKKVTIIKGLKAKKRF